VKRPVSTISEQRRLAIIGFSSTNERERGCSCAAGSRVCQPASQPGIMCSAVSPDATRARRGSVHSRRCTHVATVRLTQVRLITELRVAEIARGAVTPLNVEHLHPRTPASPREIPAQTSASGPNRTPSLKACSQHNTRCYFNVRSKANMSQLNLQHGTKQQLTGRLKCTNGYDQKYR